MIRVVIVFICLADGGGRYGSIASNANSADAQEEKDKYNSGYASITRKEYETAQKNKIYTLVFIDHNVYAEYKTFSKNRDCIPENFEFAHVDDCRIFDFISRYKKIIIISIVVIILFVGLLLLTGVLEYLLTLINSNFEDWRRCYYCECGLLRLS